MRGIEFEIVWFDQDVTEYQITCSNGPFRCAARMYLAPDDLSKVAEILSGFPSSVQDVRDVKLGAFESNAAGGGVHMNFRCVDSVGHVTIRVMLRGDRNQVCDEHQSACLHIPVEAGSIDAFVNQASRIQRATGVKAYLQMADHTVGWVQRIFPDLAAFSNRNLR